MTPETAKPEAKKPASKAEVKKHTAKKPVAKDVNKSAEIRRVATAMKARGEKPRPVVIIDTLEKQGITVSSPQVSMVLKGMGFRPRKRRKSREVAAAGSAAAPKNTGRVKVEDLVKAKKVAAQMGGIDRALAALNALKGFEG